jgi:hypothetical protein
VRFAEHLEAVADAEHGAAVARELDDGLHHRSEPGYRPGTQVVAVREASGEDDRVDAVDVAVAVPDRDRIATGEGDGAQCVAVVERTRESYDTHAGSQDDSVGSGGGQEGPQDTGIVFRTD